ncbi:hypothetical protein AMATHDRAFT_62289 [Amanita thiersii Skay4041]|uniref:Uncharacterized protein n=1 Tax=Amanita thiersii Skay4041 TaxID=703135 RepID=A0A2A9NFV3_9AGAR|nr:hypothetical protein AMATHDRAFT_62289 [Amanita thiersii Skay4041]
MLIQLLQIVNNCWYQGCGMFKWVSVDLLFSIQRCPKILVLGDLQDDVIVFGDAENYRRIITR